MIEAQGAKIETMSHSNEQEAHYDPPWADMSIVGIAGSSGSGKSSVSLEIINRLNLPWVVILVMVIYHRHMRFF